MLRNFSKSSLILDLRNLMKFRTKQLVRYVPRIEKKTAPTNPMNGSKSGTAAANAPRIKTKAARMTICVILCRSLRTLC